MKGALIQARKIAENKYFTPLGILYTAAYLKQLGHETIVLDIDPDPNNPIPRLV